ncbi:MAG: hypothetical protein EAZ95_19415, partial [Bacteroidetes bacterium]
IGLQRYSPAGASLFNPLIYNILYLNLIPNSRYYYKFNRFTFKGGGVEKVILGVSLMAMGHNFRKMATKARKNLLLYFLYLKSLFFTNRQARVYQKYAL